MRDAGVFIWGELELADEFAKGRCWRLPEPMERQRQQPLWVKSFKNYFKEVFVVGNIGTAYTGVAMDTTESSYIVAETSSFQLETVDEFHPKVSAILNLTPDHLNRHHTMEGYVNAKKKYYDEPDDRGFCDSEL